ncbi:DUF6286 domain-containing protein [Corynebacterium epidermidicanis]|uniref:DUF6286 domain-containing protein n=1 Tax=Corynebacterium epidermidicanis TaxID=1050174 RepID=A0A0G3GM26_9CORY|nr:DUF6286 domain-containing protein [Corynebacterium epidermidicanis]AKK02261.1 hypothetical protein CEPID_01900 [Corynebacterium epidermidicanis]
MTSQKLKQPKAQPAARAVALLLAVALLGVVVVVGRELWTMRTGSQLQSWLEPIFETIGTARYQPWMFPAGLFAIALGLCLIVVAFLPRRATHRQLRSSARIWVRPVDIARLCTAHAQRVPGVLRASTFATPRAINISVTGDPNDPNLPGRVEESVYPILQQLIDDPKINIRVHSRNEEAR